MSFDGRAGGEGGRAGEGDGDGDGTGVEAGCGSAVAGGDSEHHQRRFDADGSDAGSADIHRRL